MNIRDAEQRIPVSVLTGFLGSGKTTLLNHLVRQPQMNRALVIINEFGSIGLDHELMERSDDDLVVEMMGGCLCCTVSGDLLKTLRDAPTRFVQDGKTMFDRVVIETTGLADPAPILHTLMTDPVLHYQYEMRGVVTTIDAAAGMATLSAHEESVKQAAVADRLILTKTDIASAQDVASIRERLSGLNPGAHIETAINGVVDPDALFNLGIFDADNKNEDVARWLNAEAYPQITDDDVKHGSNDHHLHDHGHDHDHNDVNRHDAHIRAVCLTFDEPLKDHAFDRWISVLTTFTGEKLLRLKAIVNIEGVERPMVLHAVQHILHMPVELDAWPSDDRRTRMVLIVRDIEDHDLLQTLKLLTDGIGKYNFEGLPLHSSEDAVEVDAGAEV